MVLFLFIYLLHTPLIASHSWAKYDINNNGNDNDNDDNNDNNNNDNNDNDNINNDNKNNILQLIK